MILLAPQWQRDQRWGELNIGVKERGKQWRLDCSSFFIYLILFPFFSQPRCICPPPLHYILLHLSEWRWQCLCICNIKSTAGAVAISEGSTLPTLIWKPNGPKYMQPKLLDCHLDLCDGEMDRRLTPKDLHKKPLWWSPRIENETGSISNAWHRLWHAHIVTPT